MRSNQPLVSIGVPVYNGGPFIQQALESLLAQTYRNLEIVISDNGSTDRTAEICREYAAKDSRIRYCRSDITVDLYANFRRVLKLSSGDYFMWTSADDCRPPEAVEHCVQAMVRNPQAVMVHGPVLIKVPGREGLVEVSNAMDLSSPEPSKRVRSFTRYLQHNAMVYGLYRRDALGEAIYRSWSYGEDYLMCLQMCFLGPVEYVRIPMITYLQKALPDRSPIPDLTLTLGKLVDLRPHLRRKGWAMLLLGCYYFMKIPSLGLKNKLQAAVAHVFSFTLRYRSRLAKEIVFIIFWPVWVSSHLYRFAKESVTHR
jgi:glycosyltransferase involved in cell wall biosynthesis